MKKETIFMRIIFSLVTVVALGSVLGLLSTASPGRASHASIVFVPLAGHPTDHSVYHTCRWHSACVGNPPPSGDGLDFDTDSDGYFDDKNYFRGYGYGTSINDHYVSLYDFSNICTEVHGRVYYLPEWTPQYIGTMRYLHVESSQNQSYASGFSSSGYLNDIAHGDFVDPEPNGNCAWDGAHVHEADELMQTGGGDGRSFDLNDDQWDTEVGGPLDAYSQAYWTRSLSW